MLRCDICQKEISQDELVVVTGPDGETVDCCRRCDLEDEVPTPKESEVPTRREWTVLAHMRGWNHNSKQCDLCDREIDIQQACSDYDKAYDKGYDAGYSAAITRIAEG